MGRQLAAHDWVKAGLRQLAKQGVDALRVERLAAELKVTKGSFYWHFKDLAELRLAVLVEWERATTLAVIDKLEAESGSARERAMALARIVFGEEGSLERQVRAWAAYDKVAAGVLDRVDARRVGYVETLFAEIGLPRDVARSRSVFLYHALVGHFALGRRLQLTADEIGPLVQLLLVDREKLG